MKKMDELDRNIRLHSEELGFKAAVLALALWTLYESWQTLFLDGKYHPLPALILVLTLAIQSFSEMLIKRKMIAGDVEYSEPNKFLWSMIAMLAVLAVVISFGSYFILK